jgi:hypothetical protein
MKKSAIGLYANSDVIPIDAVSEPWQTRSGGGRIYAMRAWRCQVMMTAFTNPERRIRHEHSKIGFRVGRSRGGCHRRVENVF